MDEFQLKIESEVRAEFREMKDQVIRSFDDFEKEYLAHIAKSFESTKPRMEYSDRFTAISRIASQSFD